MGDILGIFQANCQPGLSRGDVAKKVTEGKKETRETAGNFTLIVQIKHHHSKDLLSTSMALVSRKYHGNYATNEELS